MRYQAGALIAERYRVEQLIGTGNGAEIYKVWDTNRSSFLALKSFRSELLQFPDLISRFKDEAEALSQLQHPNIVRFYEFVQRNDLIFFVMDFIDGRSLRQEIKQFKGPFEDQKVKSIVQPVCAALSYAHHYGIIHCDLKPENILIDHNGKVLLSDFGIFSFSGTNIDIPGGVGTPAYMAPEQIIGKRITSQTDQYALGVILYELLTGEKPFDGQKAPANQSQNDRVRWEHLNLMPQEPSSVNNQLSIKADRLILKCLEKEPSLRYSSVIELSLAIDTPFYESIPSTFRKKSSDPVIKPDKTGKKTGRKKNTFAFMLVVISLLLVVPVLFLGGETSSKSVNTSMPTVKQLSNTYHYLSACMDIEIRLQPRTYLRECVQQITVQPDGKLQLYLEWKVTSSSNLVGVKVYPDTNNHNMYLEDNLGNRLDHIETGEGADQEVEIFNGQSKTGWFLFPVPDKNATYFYLIDEDNGVQSPRLDRKWP